MTYCGARIDRELRLKARFVQLTHSGQIESHPHDIEMARSAPNYRRAGPRGAEPRLLNLPGTSLRLE